MKPTNKNIFLAGTFLIFVVVLVSLMRTSKLSEQTDYAILAQDLDLTGTEFVDYDYQEMAPDVIRRKVNRDPKSVAIIDIRPFGEYNAMHIVGSINFPADSMISGGVAPNYGVDMVAIAFQDTSAETLSQVATVLEKQNSYVVVLSGGISAWESAGGTTISAGDMTSFEDIAKVESISFDATTDVIAGLRNGTERRYLILDVRPAAQFKRDHLPYAINIPLADLEQMYTTLPFTKTIIVYGATLNDTFSGGVQLFDLNLPYVKSLDGGYIDWVRDGREVINTAQ